MIYFLLFFLLSCKHGKKNIETLISKTIRDTMHNPSVYKPVSAQIDSFFLDYYNTKEAKILMAKVAIVNDSFATQDEIAATRKAYEYMNNKNRSFKPAFFGWSAIHQYYIGTHLHTDTFYFNKDIEPVKIDTVLFR